MRALLMLSLFLMTAFSGCFGGDDTVRIAFVGKDTDTDVVTGLDKLAAYLEEDTGLSVDVFYFESSTAALAALKAGQADIASVDGAAAWLAWKQLGLEAFGTETRSDGRTHYMASAWVHADSDIQNVTDLAGVDSCHTGATKSAGMFMPMGYLTEQGLIDWAGYPDDISQVQVGAQDFFGTATIGGVYEGYEGALRCLSDGTGDVAFIRDTTPMDYCDEAGAATRDWCLPLDQYRKLIDFAAVPEHPFMHSPQLDELVLHDVSHSFFDMDESTEGAAILDEVFGTRAIEPVTAEEHLGQYGGFLALLPGGSGYAESK